MKKVFILYLFILSHTSYAQDSITIRNRLYAITAGYNDMYPIKEKDIIDSLRDYSSMQDYIRYAHDTTLVIRYIGFMSVLIKDDDAAFKILEQYVADSSELTFMYQCLYMDHYNRIIVNAYRNYIDYYVNEYSGGSDHDFCYVSPAKNFETWERKQTRLVQLLEQHGQSTLLDGYTYEGEPYHYDHKKYVKWAQKQYRKNKNYDVTQLAY